MLSLQEKIKGLPLAYNSYSDDSKINAYLLYLLITANDMELLPAGRRSLLKASNMLGNSIYDRCLSVTKSIRDYTDVLVYASSVFYTHMNVLTNTYRAISPKEIDSDYTKNAYNRVKDKARYRYISLPNMDMSFALCLPWYLGDTYMSIREKVLTTVARITPDLFSEYATMNKDDIISSALIITDVSLAPATQYMLRGDYTSISNVAEVIDFNIHKKGIDCKLKNIHTDSRLVGEFY